MSSSVRSSIAGAIEATDWHRARLTHKKGQRGRLRVKIMSYVLALHMYLLPALLLLSAHPRAPALRPSRERPSFRAIRSGSCCSEFLVSE